ncbi:MAG TPA: sulfate ABC transporter substrate-binding protein [Gaiellaceae bacterium]|jgi:sulfate transport system substrate-binding protein|nr:sulfate ABC transporter substrate-binding protein [Gaiellaceae bacterium]
MRRIVFVFSLVALAIMVSAVARASGKDVKLSLIAYSTPREAYAKLIPMFQATPAGKGVSFTQSYGASGDQARAVQAGLNADIVALSLAPDVDQLVKAGLVDANWKRQSYKGMVTDSVVVFAVRDGNPKHIRGWDDLLKPGIEVITPNPFTSGGARWNVMAAYGAWLKLGKTKPQAQAKLLQLFQHVAVQDKSARDALNTFLSGKGDVLLTYESEAIAAKLAGQNVQYVIPRSTILIENPIAVTRTTDHKSEAQAFVRFLKTPAAQQVFADRGYRPVVKSVLEKNRKKFPVRPGQFTIDQLGLGGWDKVQRDFFDPDRGVIAAIERKVGGATG